jgi:hypothetical protein
LLDDLGDRRGYSHLKEEALDRIKWRNRFGRGCGPVVWQIGDEWTHKYVVIQGQDPTLLRNWIPTFSKTDFPSTQDYYSQESNTHTSQLKRTWDHMLPLLFTWILSSSGMLLSVGWFLTDFSGLLIGPIFNSQAVQQRHLDPWRWDQHVLPKRRCKTNLRYVTSQKTTQLSSNVL